MKIQTIFSGIQPTGLVHIGNYLGAIKQWIDLQDQASDLSIFCIVDLHAITLPQDPKELKANILSMAALYLACGVDPKKSAIFVQSTRAEHAELAWLLNCQTRMGELYRMTQFKDKAQKGKEELSSVGLFDYPVLMAADILLYDTTHVPVGDDQKQHVEITRDLALRFNARYGETFVKPEPLIKKESSRIMGLDNPLKKMSKSADSPNNYISMTDSPDVIRAKVKRAVTDSGNNICSGKDKPAMTNILNIFSEISGKSVSQLENDFMGKGYGDFKNAFSDQLVSYLLPIQEKYQKILGDETYLLKVLKEGSDRIAPLAQKKISVVKDKIGLGL